MSGPEHLPPTKIVGGRVFCRVADIKTRPAFRGAKTGSYVLTLECGTKQRRKMSDGAGKYAFCATCDQRTRCAVAGQTPEGCCKNCHQIHN